MLKNLCFLRICLLVFESVLDMNLYDCSLVSIWLLQCLSFLFRNDPLSSSMCMSSNSGRFNLLHRGK